MGALNGTKAYLGGPIQMADPEQPNWREAVKEVLSDKFGISFFDPYSDPKQQWTASLNEAIANKNYEEMARICKGFVRKDLTLVDRSDFIISHLPYKVPTTGTHHEIIVSDNAKKATLLCCPQGREKIPAWYYGFISLNYMFGAWNELYQYLGEVDEGKHLYDWRWAYVYGRI